MIGQACGIEAELTAELKKQLRPGLDAIIRWLGAPLVAKERRPPNPKVSSDKIAPAQKAASATSTRKPQRATTDDTIAPYASTLREPAPKPISPFPEPLFEATEDPASFQDALVYHMRRFGDTYWQLYRAVVHLKETFDNKTLLSWIQGERVPRSQATAGTSPGTCEGAPSHRFLCQPMRIALPLKATACDDKKHHPT
jgi:hypothetical protein